ncbi:MAG: HK97 gp10 family phage protein [Ruminiclostridium sp.]|nr:HK97 gp10 family phage protein [Ruminiclostridium sp.]
MIKYSSEAVERALKLSAEEILREARRLCPVRTGRLKNSLTAKGETDRGEVFTDVPYASKVELGTSRQKPNPFLSGAVTASARKVTDIFRKELLKK